MVSMPSSTTLPADLPDQLPSGGGAPDTEPGRDAAAIPGAASAATPSAAGTSESDSE